MPRPAQAAPQSPPPDSEPPDEPRPFVPDDREGICPGDRTLVIAEDDPTFAKLLLDMARDRGFKGVVAPDGESGLALIRKFRPDAVTLDIRMPAMDGWKVLDILKHNPDTRHIPVHIISVEDDQPRGLHMGARAWLTKPVSKDVLEKALDGIRDFVAHPIRKLLVVEDDETQRSAIIDLIGNGDVEAIAVGTGEDALAAMDKERFDCMVLDLRLPDMTGFELLERLEDTPGAGQLPIIVYTGKELTEEEERHLGKMSDAVVIKGAKSPERLLNETALFLHRVESRLPAPKKEMLRKVREKDAVLSGRKVLIVDDDLRNLLAVSAVLERYHVEVLTAENGREGIEMLKQIPDVDVVLMDVMMPEMDGYEATRAIRKIEKFRSVPVIALTAKAMKGDREKCIEAGASDYVSKPIDPEQLLSLIRVWLYERSKG